MNTVTRIHTAERFGRWLGRGWCGYVRGERQVSAALAAKGVPIAVAAVLVWVVKLAVLGMLLYVAFWMALLLIFAIAAAWVARNTDWDEPQPELRTGLLGFGLYHPDSSRIDPHDPNEEA